MPDALTNVHAPVVVRARRLMQATHRSDAGALLVEGPQACREAARYAHVSALFTTAAAATRYDDVVAAVQQRGGEVHMSDERVIAALSTAVSPQGMVAVVDAPRHVLTSVVHPGARLVVALAAVRDPGNAGAVVRVADAVGADGVVVTPDSVDMGNAKVVRSSAGSLFHLPVVTEVDLAAAVSAAHQAGLRVLAADGSGTPIAGYAELAAPTMWVFGNEAWGLPVEVRRACDHVVSLPIYGKAESLNLATAAAVCLYASAGAQRAAE